MDEEVVRTPDPARMWEAFFKIGEHAPGRASGEEVLYADPAAAREETLAYLRILRDRVAPVVRDLERGGVIDWYSFLVHDRESGVPVSEGDRGVYVHLRFSTTEARGDGDVAGRFPPEWLLRRATLVWTAKEDARGWRRLGELSALILEIVEEQSPVSDDALVHELASLLHYAANMAQMRVA